MRRWGKLRPVCSRGECGSWGGSDCSAGLQVGGQSRRLRQQNPMCRQEREVITQGGSGKVLVVPWCPSCNRQSTPCSCSPPCPRSPGTKHAAARTAQRSIPSGKIFQNVVGWNKCYSMESALNFGELGRAQEGASLWLFFLSLALGEGTSRASAALHEHSCSCASS